MAILNLLLGEIIDMYNIINTLIGAAILFWAIPTYGLHYNVGL